MAQRRGLRCVCSQGGGSAELPQPPPRLLQLQPSLVASASLGGLGACDSGNSRTNTNLCCPGKWSWWVGRNSEVGVERDRDHSVPRVGGWLDPGRVVALTDSPLPGPAHLLDGTPRPICHPPRDVTHSPRPLLSVVRQTHSRLSRPWFTFRAFARASAPLSPMLLLENLQEIRRGCAGFLEQPGGWAPGIRVQGSPPGQCSLCCLKGAQGTVCS